jgi:hypothetical protein
VAHAWRAQCGPRLVGTGPPSRVDEFPDKSACLVKLRRDSNGRLSGRCRCSGSSWMAATLVRAGVRASISILKLLLVSQSKLVRGTLSSELHLYRTSSRGGSPLKLVGMMNDGEGVMDDPRRGGGEPTGVPGGAGSFRPNWRTCAAWCARSVPTRSKGGSIPPLSLPSELEVGCLESLTRERFRISISRAIQSIDVEGRSIDRFPPISALHVARLDPLGFVQDPFVRGTPTRSTYLLTW